MIVLLSISDIEEIIKERFAESGLNVNKINFKSNSEGIEMTLEIDPPSKQINQGLYYPPGVRTPNWGPPFGPLTCDTGATPIHKGITTCKCEGD